METKPGNGGHGPEAFNRKTGQFVADGHKNKYYPNPAEEKKISEHVPAPKIQEESAAQQTAPTPNLGDYAKGSGSKSRDASTSAPRPKQEDAKRTETLQNEYGIEHPKKRNGTDLFFPSEINVVNEDTGEDLFIDPRDMSLDIEEEIYDFLGISKDELTPEERDSIELDSYVPESVLERVGGVSQDEFEDFLKEKYRDKIAEIYADWANDRY